jgi:hypothetical protein
LPHLFHDTVLAEKRVLGHKMTRNYTDIKIDIGILFYKLSALERNTASKWRLWWIRETIKMGDVRIRQHSATFASFLYILAYPDSLIPFHSKTALLW